MGPWARVPIKRHIEDCSDHDNTYLPLNMPYRPPPPHTPFQNSIVMLHGYIHEFLRNSCKSQILLMVVKY